MIILPNKKTIIRIIFAFVLLVVLVVIYGFIFNFVKSKNESISLLSSEIYFKGVSLDREQEISRLVRTTKEEKDVIDLSFVEKEESPVYLASLENLGKDIGVEVAITNARVDEKKKTLFVTLSAEGSFGDVFAFFQALEFSKENLEIRQFSLSKELLSDDELKLGNANIWTGDFLIEVLTFLP